MSAKAIVNVARLNDAHELPNLARASRTRWVRASGSRLEAFGTSPTAHGTHGVHRSFGRRGRSVASGHQEGSEERVSSRVYTLRGKTNKTTMHAE